MLDWKTLVRGRLRPLPLRETDHEQIVAELAGHLEELYENGRAQGLSERDAIESALGEVADWQILATSIQRAKHETEEPMNYRTRSLWLPALTNLATAAGALMILQKLGVQPRVVWLGKMAIVLYFPWLFALPLFGAVGARLAKRAQAGSAHRLVAGLAPSLAMLGSFCVFLVVSFATGAARLAEFPFGYFALTVLNWVVLPAFALLLGTLPFLRKSTLVAA